MLTCAHKMSKNIVSCFRTIRKNKDDLAKTTYKYETQYRGNSSDILNKVGDQYHIALTVMQGCKKIVTVVPAVLRKVGTQ